MNIIDIEILNIAFSYYLQLNDYESLKKLFTSCLKDKVLFIPIELDTLEIWNV